MRKPERRRKLVSDINIVPLTDVLLVLLVIFMVTTPMIVQGNIQVKLPHASALSDTQLQPITLTLTVEDRLFLGDQEVRREDLPVLLKAALKTRTDKLVVIRADRACTHGSVVELMDLARQCGAERLAIATEAKP
jgi:biopolymer transport protein ExbD